MRIAGAALNQTPIDWENNLRNIRMAIERAKVEGVQLLCLPELCLTGYGCEDLFLSEWLPAAALAQLQEVLPWTQGICVAVGLPVRFEHATYNTAAVLRDGEVLGFVAKQFLANDGVHYEPRFFRPWVAGTTATVVWEGQQWPLGDLTFEHQGVRFGFEICEDAWRADDVRPLSRLRGRVDLVLNPSASHFAMSKTDLRYQLVLNASRNFECTYLYANLLGNEAGRITYDGEILVARNGHLLRRNQLLSFQEVDLEYVDVDFAAPLPPPEALALLPAPDEYLELNQALALALFDYLRKARSRGFVLSLSGGADSSICAVAVAEMVRLGVAELGEAEFRRRSGCLTMVEAVVTQTGAGGVAVQVVEPEQPAINPAAVVSGVGEKADRTAQPIRREETELKEAAVADENAPLPITADVLLATAALAANRSASDTTAATAEAAAGNSDTPGVAGADSPAASAEARALANARLVNELLTCAYQGTVNSSDDTLNSARILAESIGARFLHWAIDEEVAGYVGKIEQALGRELAWDTDDLALQNIQARVRAPAIWLVANIQNCLLITTSNRSEASVGYCTMDGDTAGSISPIAGIDKDFVKKWLRWAETELGYTGLRPVNGLVPTAELRPLADAQTDERDLMPYALLNRIERLAFYDRLSPSQVLTQLETEATGFDRPQLVLYVRRFYQLWSRNQWKRERYAPSFHLDDYNVDPRSWLRFPILSGGFHAELAAL